MTIRDRYKKIRKSTIKKHLENNNIKNIEDQIIENKFSIESKLILEKKGYNFLKLKNGEYCIYRV